MKKFKQLAGIISSFIMCDSLLAAGTYYNPQIAPKDQSILNFFSPKLGFTKRTDWNSLPDVICEPDACRKDKQVVCYRGKKDPGTVNNKKSCQQQQRERLYMYINPRVGQLSTDGLPADSDPNPTPVIPIIVPPRPDPVPPPPPPPPPVPPLPIPIIIPLNPDSKTETKAPSAAVCSIRGAKALRMNINKAFASAPLTDPIQKDIRGKEWAALNAALVAILPHTDIKVKQAKLKAIYNTNNIYQKAMSAAYPSATMKNISVFSSCYKTLKDNESFNLFIKAFLNPASVATPKGVISAKKN